MTHKGGCHCGRIAFEVEGDINVRCPEGVDLSALKVVPFDGRSL